MIDDAETVVDQQPQNPGHEEAIIPVKPRLKGPRPAVSREDPKRARSVPVLGVALGLLVAMAVVVFFVLPTWVAEQDAQEPVVAAVGPAAPAEPEGPTFTPEELEALEAEAESLLALLLPQQGQLDRQSAAEWGGEDFERYQELSRDGDDAFLVDAFYDAVPAYSQALELGEALLERSIDLIAAALSAGEEALAAGNSVVALAQFQLVLGIEAGNSRATAGLRRAQQLPEVLALMLTGEEFERGGGLEEAAQAYRDALTVDSLWAPARAALAAVTERIRDRGFDTLMSRGLSALTQEEYGEAYEIFTQALVLRPDSSDALDSQTQAEQGQKLDQIALAEARALAFESRELWEMAIRLYRDALETDATLAFAQQGLERAQRRADLDLKLANLIDNANLLLDDRVLSDAEQLLVEARGIPEPGPRLGEQITDLGRLVQLASTPIQVVLQSDERTEVTVYRVGKLGRFVVKHLELRPGSYTAVGSRDGYVDVRQTFSVVPGRELAPIKVECIDAI